MLSCAKMPTSEGSFNATKASGEPEHLVIARGKFMDYDRSDLEKTCVEIA